MEGPGLLGQAAALRRATGSLAGVTQWTECRPVNQRVAGLIPSLGNMPGLRARSPVGGM